MHFSVGGGDCLVDDPLRNQNVRLITGLAPDMWMLALYTT
jgi:hypothetical protein